MLLRSHAPAARKQQSLLTHVVSYGRLALILLLSAGLLWASLRHVGLTQSLRSSLAESALQIRSAVHGLFTGLKGSVEDTVGHFVQAELSEAHKFHLQKLNVRLAQLEQENQALRDNLKVMPKHELSYQTVAVVDVRLNPTGSSLWLGAGHKQGLAEGDVVVSGQHLIGRVVEVTPNYSRVLLVQDPQSHVPVVGVRSGVHGIVSGQDAKPVKLSIIEGSDVLLEQGEVLLTSGRGGLFPKGLFVAVAQGREGAVGWAATSLNLAQLDFVQVIKGLDPLPQDE